MTTKCPCCGTMVDQVILVTANTLAFGDIRVSLPPRETQVMRVLVNAMPGIAGRDEIIRALWTSANHPADADNNLQVSISTLRHVLVGSPFAIKTVRTIGYRLERIEPATVGASIHAIREAARG